MPVTIITIQSLFELTRFWRNVNIDIALDNAKTFALENYSYRLERFEELALKSSFGTPREAPEEFAAVQDFEDRDGIWVSREFSGDPSQEMEEPPAIQEGFVPREIRRDRDMVRYILYPEEGVLRVLSYSLGEGFDQAVAVIEEEAAHVGVMETLRSNVKPLLVFYYGVFFLPTLLMTVIIAISFTLRVTQPLTELAEATGRVAEGDFSIQILSRPKDELGHLIGSFNAMVRDLEKSRSALVKAEKISIWQSMAQQLAHEIKNPLTPIKLSAERVLRRWRNEPERIGEILESSMLAIIQETEGLSTLVTEFRTLSHPLEPSHSRTILKDAVEEAAALYRNSYPEVHVNTAHVGEAFLVKIDRRYISQILTNLFINGIDAMDGKGDIEVRTDLVEKRESRFCRLSVMDTGKGIPEEEGARIFTPYFTTKATGTGLGLPIVERIVNDHGGSIWFNSSEGLGTTFFVDLPLDMSQSPSPGGQDG
ncbi:hypothetical protein FACS189468_3520 [Spirochaetia bacterium]|nr:hypothetical protein FACS189468_3520 [Spirochaetia bacterium]